MPEATCMRGGKCSKGVPHPFVDDTLYNGRNGPVYRRRIDGRTSIYRGAVIDNIWIVLYTALWYRNHVNFETCVCLSSIKYIHKYVRKGPDYISAK